MSSTATTNAFGLNFASSISAAALIINDESQLHGTSQPILINNQNLGPLSSSLASSSICSNSNSSIGSCNSSSMKLELANSSSAATMAAGTIDTTASNTSITMVSPVNNNNATNGNVSSPPPPPSSSTIIAASSSSSPSSFKAASASSTAAAAASSSAVTANNNYESTHSRLIAGYPRLSGLYSSTYAAAAAAATAHPESQAAAAASSAFYQTNGASFYPSLNSHYDLDKSSGNSWTPLTSQASYSPYDAAAAAHHSFYGPYSNCYGAIDSAARRKNATRETTNTLKAWLYEHRKNPYPTKGEKIMLAIITKMTLTQVSTWFANARRRLKKENKMTWEPKNKSTDSLRDNDSDKDSQKDCDEDTIIINKNDNGNGLRIKSNHHEQQQPRGHNGGHIGGGQSASTVAPISGIGTNHHMSKGHLLSNHHGQVPPPTTATVQHSQTPAFGLPLEGDNTMDGQRPKIWSLAQTATTAEASAAAAAAAAAASLAGRLYPSEWSAAAYAAQFQSPSMSENLSLINPLTEHYHNHHAHHNNHGGTASNQAVGHLNHHITSHHNQSPPTNPHVQSPINSQAQPPPPPPPPHPHHHHHFYSTPPPPPPPPSAATKPNSMWNNLDMEQINGSTHHLMRNHHSHGHNNSNNLANNNHTTMNGNNNNFGCSPVSSFLSGNLQMSI